MRIVTSKSRNLPRVGSGVQRLATVTQGRGSLDIRVYREVHAVEGTGIGVYSL